MKAESLTELYHAQLQDILSAEKQLVAALPKMAEAATNPKVKAGFEKHLEETKGQVERLKQVFESLGKAARAHTCEAMKGLVKEGEEVIEAKMTPEVRDAGLICAAQKVEHYEIASYGTLIEYARILGFKDQMQLLQETLAEEKNCDKQLTIAAETSINELAKAA